MCLGAHVSECLPANNLTGPVISAKRAFHCSHRTASETGNGTHTPHSEPERNSLWAAPYYTHTHYIQRNLSRPKTNTILESITAKKNPTSTSEQEKRAGWWQLCNCGVIASSSLYHSADSFASSPFLTLNSNLPHSFDINVSPKQDLVDLCDNQEGR